MKTINVSAASGTTLDWLVAKAEGLTEAVFEFLNGAKTFYVVIDEDGVPLSMTRGMPYCPSTDWSLGGPIIDREQISTLHRAWGNGDAWLAMCGDATDEEKGLTGPTALIAAMRCYVTSKLGETAEVPDELVN